MTYIILTVININCIINTSIVIDIILGGITMSIEYREYANIFKALSDPTRLKIIDMVSCSPMCACDILEKVEIVQSTLSYHMKILTENNLVTSKQNGTWTWYYINHEKVNEVVSFLNVLSSDKKYCICNIDISPDEYNQTCKCSKD
jgi:ArsR family transcriptional regulator, arsenate/arsenite/antimonite-responsive transcriptional repressor